MRVALTIASASLLVTTANAQTAITQEFVLQPVSTGLPGTISGATVAPSSFGTFEGHVFVVDTGEFSSNVTDGKILRIDPNTGSASQFVELDGDPFYPEFGPGGEFGEDLYVSAKSYARLLGIGV